MNYDPFTAGNAVFINDELYGEPSLYPCAEFLIAAATETFGECEGITELMISTERIQTIDDNFLVLTSDGNVMLFDEYGALLQYLHEPSGKPGLDLPAIAALFGDK